MTDFGGEMKHAEFEQACTKIERQREMFHGAVSGTATDADRQHWCERAAWCSSSWLAVAAEFVRNFDWGPFGWGNRCDALDEIKRMRKELKA
jgi:hypothetical protein